ncbi:MAG: hypothetical protein EHM33_18250 [Chloroflexi bacterium]|nr:MAG: hypothetical protein EHM33_18250 [Chloroflexota bacterium]
MIRLTVKQLFLLKMTLGVVIANAAGRTLADGISFSGRWDGAFIYSFLPLTCIVVMQWILLSDYLPKWWMITGLIGCVISASVMGTINFYVPDQIFRLIIRELNIFNNTLMGILVALPQWFVLKHKRGYMWVLANGIGWLLSAAYRNSIFYQQHDFWRISISETSFIPVGLSLSLYLYSYVYKVNTQEIH